MRETSFNLPAGAGADVTITVPGKKKPPPLPAKLKAAFPPPTQELWLPMWQQVKDAGTNAFTVTGSDGEPAIQYTELTMEGTPNVTYRNLSANRALMLEAIDRQAFRLPDGGPISNTWALQADSNTAKANATLRIKSGDHTFDAALANSAPYWKAEASIAEQRTNLALLREHAVNELNPGLDQYEAELDAQQNARWGFETVARVRDRGHLLIRIPNGEATQSLACPYNYEPWDCGSTNYYATEGDNAYSPEVPLPKLWRAGERNVESELWLVPQLQRVLIGWLAVYLVAGPWMTIIYLPTNRSFTWRSGIFPFMWAVPSSAFDRTVVDDTVSTRVSRTNAYASAILSDVSRFALYFFIERVQGFFQIFRVDPQPRALCAVYKFRSNGTTKRVSIYRREGTNLATEMLQQGALYVPGEVSPYRDDFFAD